MKTSHVEAALEEMDFEMVENGAGLELPSSKPASFSFTEPVELDEDRVYEGFRSKDFAVLTPFIKRKEGSEKFVWEADLYTDKRMAKTKVKIWRDSVRIYPREDGVELTELAQITSAIESAMNATLEHDPIEQ